MSSLSTRDSSGRESFSVVMSVYAGSNAEHLSYAIESVLTQSVVPEELIIAIDGPVGPDLKSLLSGYAQNQRVRIEWLPINRGPGVSKHEAIRECSTEIIAIMDADDISVQKRFELQLEALKDRAVGVVGGQIEEFQSIPGDLGRIRSVPLNHGQIVRLGRTRHPLNHVTLMFRRRVYEMAGGYGSGRVAEDYDLYFRMYLCSAKFVNLDHTLVLVRCGSSLAERRQGFSFLCQEMLLFTRMRHAGYISWYRWSSNLVARLLLRNAPKVILDFVYQYGLRRRTSTN